MTSPILPAHPLDRPDVVKIVLGESASDALKALGKHCLPITKERADAAYNVATGKMRAVTPRAPKT